MVENLSPNSNILTKHTTTQAELYSAARMIEKAVAQNLRDGRIWERASQYLTFKEFPDLVIKRVFPLPSVLFEQYAFVESKCFMGVFPEIERAWFSVDNKLFLWNYSQEGDFNAYDVSEQVIVSVCLAAPREGVFADRFRYVLVVANTIEILLFGVSITGSGPTQSIVLVPTRFRVATDYVNMLKMTSTTDGRVFMCGNDGCLYEFVYGNRVSGSLVGLGLWDNRTFAKKINHSSSFAKYLLPDIFKRFMNEDALIDVCIDQHSRRLYSLSESGTLNLYEFSGTSQLSRISSTSISEDIKRFVGMEGRNRPRVFLCIVATCLNHVENKLQDEVSELMAFTSLGERIFYCVHRSPIGTPTKYRPFVSTDTTYPLIHVAFWSKGFVLLSDARDPVHDTIVAIQPAAVSSQFSDYSLETNARSSEVIESITQISLHELVSEADPSFREHTSTLLIKAWAFSEKNVALDIYSDLEDEKKAFLCLTNTALIELERQGPLDHLCRSLSTETSSPSSSLNAFVNRYGNEELCAQCVNLTSKSLFEDEIVLSPRSNNNKIVEDAIRIFFAFGGSPQVVDSFAAKAGDTHLQKKFDIGRPAKSISAPFKYSYGYYGIVLKLSRDVAKMWNNLLVNRTLDDFLTLNSNPQEMKKVRNRVQGTYRFIQRYVLQGTDYSSSSYEASQIVSDARSIQNRLYRDLFQRKKHEEAKKAEWNSFLSLYFLGCRISEALSLLSILHDHQFHRLVTQVSEDSRFALLRITFGEFCSSEVGKRLSSSLITALFQFYAYEDEEFVESLTEHLSSQCPSFFGKDERCLQRGMELLSRARAMMEQHEDTYTILSLVEQATENFKKVIHVIDNWKEICSKIESVGAISQLFGLLIDAVTATRLQQQAERREECYTILLSMIHRYLLADGNITSPLVGEQVSQQQLAREDQWKENVIQRIRQLKDETFHRRLYPFLISLGSSGISLLIRLNSPFAESFLIEQKRFDILWKYYGHEGRYKEAAAVLVKYAREDSHLSLEERMMWLGQALHFANLQLSKAGIVSGDERLIVKEIQDYLEVAKIQVRCKEELNRRHPEWRAIEDSTAPFLQALDNQLLDLSTIYNHLARPLELWETELDILRCAGYEDTALVHHLWSCLIDNCLVASSDDIPTLESWRVLESLLLRLGKDFSSSSSVFPLDFLIQVLEQRHLEWRQTSSADNKKHLLMRSPIRIFRWFLSIGHLGDTVMSMYCKCLEERFPFAAPAMKYTKVDISSWGEDTAQYHLIEMIKYFLEECVSPAANERFQFSFREETIHHAVSLCCNRLRIINVSDAESWIKDLSRFKKL
eukprot:jgi/Galph1/2601/GphlegSOOS_G1236.1